MKVRKGTYGYVRYEKKRRLLVTIGMFVMPLAILIAGLIICNGDKNNIFTVIAVVGCLPACRHGGSDYDDDAEVCEEGDGGGNPGPCGKSADAL